jgi:hypothetical protein
MPEFSQTLEDTSEEFRKLFLLAFTKELIKNSVPELKAIIERREREKGIEIEEIPPKIPLPIVPTAPMPTVPGVPKPGFKALPKPFRIPPRLMIPAARLPERLRYIRPVARLGVEIDLGKLNPLIADPVIQTIECNGPNERVIIRDPGQKATNITLSKEEIDSVIQKFSESAKIPIVEGVFRVAFGKLVLSAIISDVVGSKFMIKKLRYTPAAQEAGISRLQPPRVFTG